LRSFSAIQSGFLDLCSIVNLSNDAVLGAKDIYFFIRKLIPPVLVPIDAAVWTESIKGLP